MTNKTYQVQIRRGSNADHATFIGAVGELSYNTDTKTIHIHDGVTQGGMPLTNRATFASFSGGLSTVATTGSYNDLTNLPVIPTVPTTLSSFTNDSGFLTSTSLTSYALSSSIPTDLIQLTNDAGFITSSALTGFVQGSSLSAVATSGSYSDLSDKPTIPTVPTAVSAFTNDAGYLSSSSLATVATSGSYSDLSDKPTIPTSLGQLPNDAGFVIESSLSAVATSGSYSELINTPVVLTDLSSLTNDVGYVTSSSLSVYALSTALPTTISQLTNDVGYITSSSLNGLALLTDIPTKTSELTNDNGFITSSALNNYALTSSVPTAVSQLPNDAGYVTSIPVTSVNNKTGAIELTSSDISGLSTVASSGSYNDLINKPTLVASATTDTTNASNITSGTLSTSLFPTISGLPTGMQGSGSAIPVITVDNHGRITGLTTTSVYIPIALSELNDVLEQTLLDKDVLRYNLADAKWENVQLIPENIGAVSTTSLGIPGGVATLDSNGAVPMEQIPTSLTNGMVFGGTWDASTTWPYGSATTSNKGTMYKVSVSGSNSPAGTSITTWVSGDIVISDGANWDKIAGVSSEVVSVAGRIGAVTLTASDIGGLALVATSGSYNDLTNKPTIAAKTSQLVNDANFVSTSGLTTTLASYISSGALSTALSSYAPSASLSGYVTTGAFASTLATYVSTSGLTTALSSYATTASLAGYVTTTGLGTTLGSYVSTGTLTTTLASYVTTTSLTSTLTSSLSGYVKATSLTGYALSSALPTKVSQLTNDSGFVTSSTLTGYVLSTALSTYATISSLSSYLTASTLPTASTTTLGAVKVDGNTVIITNGVLSAPAGTAYSAGTGITLANKVITNTGVTGITGTANQIIASASSGAVTLTLPQSISTTSSPTFGGLTVTGTSSFGTVTTTTANPGDNSTLVASTAFVNTALAGVGSPTTTLLMHFDNSLNDATNLISTTSTSSVVYQTNSKFGSASLSGSGAVALTNTVNLTGDFTIEFWFNPTGRDGYPGGAGLGQGNIITLVNGSTTNFSFSGTDNYGTVYASGNVLGTNYAGIPSGGGWPNYAYNAWVHTALVRSGSNFKWYQNGTLAQTVTVSTAALSFNTINFNPATYAYLDEFRISNTAIYTSNFIVPNTAFSTYLPGYATVVSPTFTGSPSLVTSPVTTDNSTKLATTAFVKNVIGTLSASATTDTTNASNITSGTLSVSRLPVVSGLPTTAQGSGTSIPVITVSSNGLVTSLSTTSVNIVSALSGLSDVTLTSPANGNVLQYNGTKWVNVTLTPASIGAAAATSLASYALATSLNAYALSSALASYVSTTSLATTLTSYVTTSSLSTTLGSYVTTSSLSTTLNSYTKATALNAYALTTALSSYATITSLSSYALSSALASYVSTGSLSTTLGTYVTTTSLASTLSSYGADAYTISINHFDNNLTDLMSNISSTSGSPSYNSNFKFGTYSFSGSATMNLVSAISLNDFTFDFWFYNLNYSQTFYPTIPVVALNNGTTNIANFFESQSSYGSCLSCNVNGAVVVSQFTNNYANGNGWVHLAIVRSGSTATFYINGNASGSANVGSTPLTLNNISLYPNGNCLIDELRVSSNARYTGNFTAPTSPYSVGYISTGYASLGGSPTATNPLTTDNSNRVATTSFVKNLMGSVSGIATLDSNGTLSVSQIPAALVGALQYKGTWNASTNSPTLTSGTGTTGQFYKVSTNGTNSTLNGVSTVYMAGDLVLFDGTSWDKIEGQPTDVTSVAGKIGSVTLVQADIGGLTTSSSPIFSGVTATTFTGTLAGNASTATNVASSGITGTTLASNVVSSSLTSLGTLTALTVSGSTSLQAATATTVLTSDNSTNVATTAFVKNQNYVSTSSLNSSLSSYVLSTTLNAYVLSTTLSGYVTTGSLTSTLSSYALTSSVPVASSTTPVMNGTAALGTGTTWARADHVHGSDTTKANTASPTFTGTVTVGSLSGYMVATSGVLSTISTIPNSGLTNSSIILGTSTVALGSTLSTIAGLTSVTATTFTGSLTGTASFATSASTATTAGTVTTAAQPSITSVGTLTTLTISGAATTSTLTVSSTSTHTGLATFNGGITVSGSSSLATATATTVAKADNSTNVATTAWVNLQGYGTGTGSGLSNATGYTYTSGGSYVAGSTFIAGTTYSLALPITPTNQWTLQVYFDGIYQHHNTFSYTGTTLTFTGNTPIPTGVASVEIVVLG